MWVFGLRYAIIYFPPYFPIAYFISQRKKNNFKQFQCVFIDCWINYVYGHLELMNLATFFISQDDELALNDNFSMMVIIR